MAAPAPTAQPRAAIYVRVSSEKQEDNFSLPTQEDACREYAEARGFRVAETYREVYSGAALWERPQLAVLRDRVRRGEIDVVIAYAIDRLSRKQTHLAIVADECERAGVELRFATEEFEKTAIGEFIRGAKTFAAELEREKIHERTMRGKRARVLSGRLSPSSRPLYGYTWADDTRSRYAIDPQTGPVVRRVFEDALAGRTLRNIAHTLTAEGIPSAKGGAWDFVTVRTMLRNPAYQGEAHAFRTRMVPIPGSTKKRKITLPREEWIPLPEGTIPPLVDGLAFAAVQQRLTLNQARASRNTKDPSDWLLHGGYVKCGYCGWSTHARRINGDAYYSCRKDSRTTGSCQCPTIRATILDRAVWACVSRVLTDPAVVERELRRMEEDETADIDLAAVERTLADVKRKRDNLIDRLADVDDATIATAVGEKLAAFGQQQRQLEQERDLVLGRRASWAAAQRRLVAVQNWCGAVAARLGELGYHEKRIALDALDVRVRIFTKDHAPRYVITASIPLEEDEGGEIILSGAVCVDTVSRLSCGRGRPTHCRPS